MSRPHTKIRPLGHGRRDHEAAVRAAEDGDAGRIGDPSSGDVLRDRIEIVVGVLLPLERSVAVEAGSLFAAAADVREHERCSRLDELGICAERPADEGNVPAAVGVEDGRQSCRLEIGAVDDLVADRRAIRCDRLVVRDDERELRFRRPELHDPAGAPLIPVDAGGAVGAPRTNVKPESSAEPVSAAADGGGYGDAGKMRRNGGTELVEAIPLAKRAVRNDVLLRLPRERLLGVELEEAEGVVAVVARQRSSLFDSWSNHIPNSVNCVPEIRSSATSTIVAVVISLSKKIREQATTIPSSSPSTVISVPRT